MRHRGRLIRSLFLAAMTVAMLSPAAAMAQDRTDCRVDTDTATADDGGTTGGEVTPDTGTVIVCRGVGQASGGGAGVGAVGGGVNRIDAGAGATAAVGAASVLPWVMAAGAGVTGSVLRRRRR
jgi:hypothetical protein